MNPAPARTRRKGALPTTAARDTLVSARRRHFLGRDEHSREVTRRPGVPVEQAAETRVGLQSPDARRPPFPSTRSLARPAASSSDPRQCNAPRLSTHVAGSAWHTAAFGPIGVPGVSSLYIIRGTRLCVDGSLHPPLLKIKSAPPSPFIKETTFPDAHGSK